MEIDNIPADLLHTLRSTRSCLNFFFLAFGFRKGLPYIDEASTIISRLLESGITDYWLDRISENYYTPATFSKVYEYKQPIEEKNAARNNDVEPLSMKHLQGVFYVWLVGMTISFVQLIYETHKNTIAKKKFGFYKICCEITRRRG